MNDVMIVVGTFVTVIFLIVVGAEYSYHTGHPQACAATVSWRQYFLQHGYNCKLKRGVHDRYLNAQ